MKQLGSDVGDPGESSRAAGLDAPSDADPGLGGSAVGAPSVSRGAARGEWRGMFTIEWECMILND